MSTVNGDSIPAGDENAVSGETNSMRPEVGKQPRPDSATFEEAPAGKEHADSASPDSGLIERLTAKIKELEEENSSVKDLYLRKAADFENFRKRSAREREESLKFANSSLLLDLIPTIDDFERAIKSAEDSHDFDAFHAGVVLIEKRMVEMLERKHGLRRFESAGEVFDPMRHEAVSVAEIMPPADSRIVIEDYQKGFMLHDRVLRTAKVLVSQEPAPGSAGQNADQSGLSTEKEGEQ